MNRLKQTLINFFQSKKVKQKLEDERLLRERLLRERLLREKQLALLEDTVAYYSEDITRRCSKASVCYYSPETLGLEHSDGCAIGRLLEPELKLKLDKYGQNSYSHVNFRGVWEQLPEHIQYYTPEFLSVIQFLHDTSTNWGSNGLTEDGLNRVVEIKRDFKLV